MPVGTHWLKNHWAKKQSIATIYSTPETRATNPIAHHESWQQFYDNQFIDGALSMLILRRDLFVCLFRVVITERYVTNSSPYLRARGRGPFLRSHFHKTQCRGLGSCRESQCHLTAQEGICWYPKTGHCLWSHYIMIWYGSCRGGKKPLLVLEEMFSIAHTSPWSHSSSLHTCWTGTFISYFVFKQGDKIRIDATHA